MNNNNNSLNNKIKSIILGVVKSIKLNGNINNDIGETTTTTTVELKENIQDQQIQHNNIGTLKSSNTSISTTTTIEQGELLFWKVFRNKWIFYYIFSNFKFKSICPYSRLVDIYQIIYGFSNGIEIIRDKVKCGKYIILNNNDSSIIHSVVDRYDTPKEYSGLVEILLAINKSNKENIEFYKQLFNNYSSYFLEMDQVLQLIFQFGSVFIMDLYINHFKLTKDQLEKSFRDFIYTSFIDYQSLKIYDYLKQHYPSISLSNCIGSFNFFSTLFNFKQLLNSLIILSKNNIFNNSNNQHQQHNNIIESYLSVSKLKSLKETFKPDQLKLNIITLIESLKQSNNNNNSISSSQSTAATNSSSSNNNNSNSSLIESIKNLIEEYFQHASNVYKIPPLEYFIALLDDLNEILKIAKDREMPIFNHYEILLNKCKSNQDKFNLISNEFKRPNIITRDREPLNLDYEEHLITYREYPIIKLLSVILGMDDLDLVEYTFKNHFDIIEYLFKYKYKKEIIQSIKSTKIMDYLYDNTDLFTNDSNIWIHFTSISLLEYYESKIKSSNHQLTFQKYKRPSRIPSFYQSNSMALELLVRAIKLSKFSGISSNNNNNNNNNNSNSISNNSNSNNNKIKSVYNLSNSFKLEDYKFIIQDSLERNQQDLIIQLFDLVNKDINFVNLLKDCQFNSKLYHISNWLFTNFKIDLGTQIKINKYIKLESNRINKYSGKPIKVIISLNQLMYLYLSNGLYEEMFNLNITPLHNTEYLLEQMQSPHCLPSFIDQLINYCLRKKDQPFQIKVKGMTNSVSVTDYLIYSSLSLASIKGNLAVVEFIILSYSSLFIKSVYSSPLLYCGFDHFLSGASDSGSIEIIQILKKAVSENNTHSHQSQ